MYDLVAELGHWVRGPVGARLGVRQLAEEIFFLDCGKAGVRIGAADHAVLVGIDAELLLKLETVLERGAGVFELQHFWLLIRAQVEVASVPSLVIGEFVIGREERMRLAVALHLGGFNQRFELGARLGVLPRQRIAADRIDERKHKSVGKIAVVRNSKDAATGFVLVGLERLPEVLGIVADKAGKRQYLRYALAAVAEHHHAVEVVALGLRRPLVADEGRELSGIVVFLGGLDVLFPDGPCDFHRRQCGGQRLSCPASGRHNFIVDLHRLVAAALKHLVPALEIGIAHQGRVARLDLAQDAHILGMVGHHQKIQRTAQPGALPVDDVTSSPRANR